MTSFRETSARKPGTSETSRTNKIGSSSIKKPHTIFKRNNFNRGEDESLSYHDNELKEYYQKEENKSKSKSKSRKKDIHREMSLEETRRLKHLEKIYLAPQK